MRTEEDSKEAAMQSARSGPQAKLGAVSFVVNTPISHISGARFGIERPFKNEDDTTQCFELIVNGNRIAWVFKAYQLSFDVVFWQCIPLEDGPLRGAGQISGWADYESIYALERSEGGWGLSPITSPPGYWFMSREQFCGDKMAYWAYKNGEHAIAVYDFSSGKIVNAQSLGNFVIQSVSPWYFPAPRWDEACAEVEFPANYFLRSPVLFSFH